MDRVCCRGQSGRVGPGAHIELTRRPGEDYETGAAEHTAEHRLQLDPAVLTELAEVLDRAGPEPARSVRDHFIVHPVRALTRFAAHICGHRQAH